MRRNLRFSVATLQLFQHPENVNISIFPFTNSHLKNAISPEVFYEFFKPFFGWKKWNLAIVVENFRVRRYFGFAIGNVTTFPKSRKCKYFNFAFHTVPAWNVISPEVFIRSFLKLFFGWKQEEGAYCCWKFQLRRYSRFPIATLQFFRHPQNVNVSIFPFQLSQQKYDISRSI